MHPALKRMCDRFPMLGEQAVARFASDESFRDLCEDYDTCAATLTHLESSASPPEGIVVEYTALLLRLEHEVLRLLEQRRYRGES